MRMRAGHDPTGHPPITEAGDRENDRSDGRGGYRREIDAGVGPVIEHLMARADPQPGEAILDFGTGTGSVAAAGRERAWAGQTENAIAGLAPVPADG